ncbi:hypothetical protein GYA49_05370 [Candidatus Beckwithbacteria bacterium]|nr:hypothetical protein [Candidatus Beckwithbacteria bacterium]
MLFANFTQEFVIFFALYTILFSLLFIPKISKRLKKLNYQYLFWGVLGLQLLTIALIKKEITDVMLFSGAGWHLRHGIDFYFIDSDHGQYPFFPFLIFAHAVFNYLTETIKLFPFVFYLKLLLIAALQYLGFFIYKKTKSQILQLQFLLCPITFAVVLYHGQIDVILLAFLLASLQFLLAQKLQTVVLGALLLAASIATKTWSIVFLPLIAWFQKNMFKVILTGLLIVLFLLGDVFIYTRLVFGSSVRTVLPAVLAAGGPIGHWGWPLLVSFIIPISVITNYKFYLFILLLGVVFAILVWKKLPLTISLLGFVLGLYLVIPNWGIQYSFWVLPFLFLSFSQISKPWTYSYLFLSSILVFANYLNLSAAKSVFSVQILDMIGIIVWLWILLGFYLLVAKKYEKNRDYLT